MFRGFVLLLVAFLTLATGSTASAQTTLSTGLTPNTNTTFDGQMFDVRATTTTTITGISAQIGVGTVRIWGRPGTHVGAEQNMNAWTLLGTGTVVNATSIQPIAITLNTTIAAGQTYAFYIDANQDVEYLFNPPGAVGDTIVSDANIAILKGTGLLTSFSPTVAAPRDLAGAVTYISGAAAVPTMTECAMILFGLLLAGGAMIVVQRRGSVA